MADYSGEAGRGTAARQGTATSLAGDAEPGSERVGVPLSDTAQQQAADEGSEGGTQHQDREASSPGEQTWPREGEQVYLPASMSSQQVPETEPDVDSSRSVERKTIAREPFSRTRTESHTIHAHPSHQDQGRGAQVIPWEHQRGLPVATSASRPHEVHSILLYRLSLL